MPEPLPYKAHNRTTVSPSGNSTKTIRSAIFAIAIAAITATGAYYGASLKTSHQAQARLKEREESPVPERLERLQGVRARLERERKGLEEKMVEVAARRKEAKRIEALRGIGKGG